MTELSLGFSPCPNDTFIFFSMLNRQNDKDNIRFVPSVEDVETLNRMATQGELDITKLSFHAWAHVADQYALLTAGAALGFGNGPVLISKHKIYPDEIPHLNIAIPGKLTTANLLLGIHSPEIASKREYLFSDIEEAVLSGETDAGLIIHETRFTYQKKGLQKILDLGEWWEKETGKPLPLGGIAIRRSLVEQYSSSVNTLIRSSVETSIRNPKAAEPYIIRYSNEKDPEVISKHIKLYVNDYTRDLKKEGREAIELLMQRGSSARLIPLPPQPFFCAND